MRKSSSAWALVAPLVAVVQVSGASSPTGGEREGSFGHAELIAALRTSGATVSAGGPIEQPFFSVPGRVVVVDGADVQVFEYRTVAAMEADAARIAPDGGSVGTTIVAWVEPPHFFRRDRVLVLYVGTRASVLSALSAALGPQFAGR